jgi:hypothetical protein
MTLLKIGLIVGAVLISSVPAYSQSAEQTVAYIISGGFVELDQIKPIDSNSVYIPKGRLMNNGAFGATSNASGIYKAIGFSIPCRSGRRLRARCNFQFDRLIVEL